jgi:predicted DNA-binding protein
MSQKSITLRLPVEEYMAFDAVCSERGYSKTGKIREFIRRLVKSEIETVEVSAEEWDRIRGGMTEIAAGDCVSFEELKRAVSRKTLANRQDRPER